MRQGEGQRVAPLSIFLISPATKVSSLLAVSSRIIRCIDSLPNSKYEALWSMNLWTEGALEPETVDEGALEHESVAPQRCLGSSSMQAVWTAADCGLRVVSAAWSLLRCSSRCGATALCAL